MTIVVGRDFQVSSSVMQARDGSVSLWVTDPKGVDQELAAKTLAPITCVKRVEIQKKRQETMLVASLAD
ncbi:MAG: hypothetical protein AB7P69_27230 [Candidatus Binatia bacterium]